MNLKISNDLNLPIEAVTQTFAILAKRGAGKSYTGCVMVEEMLAANQQVVIADPVGVWWGLRSSADGKSPGFSIVVFGGEHGDLPLEETAGEIVAQSIIENGFSAVLDLSLFRKAAQNRFMLAFAEALYRLNRKPLHFMVDEADEFAPQRPLHGNERLLGAFEDIVRRGRARGLGVTLITQRAAVLNKNVLTQIEVLVVLRTISPQDREAIEAWTEIHGTKKQLEQLSETMASLPIGTAWFWSPGWLDIFKKIAVRKKITFDSSATPKVGETITKPKALAAVNLEQLGAQIKATAENAKANDPAILKKEIARLQKEVASKVATGNPITETKVVPVLKDTELRHIKLIFRNFESAQSSLADAVKLIGGIAPVVDALKFELSKFTEQTGKNKNHWTISAPPFRAGQQKMSLWTAKPATVIRRPVSTHRPVSEISANLNGDMPSGGLRRMLIALAQRPGLSARQLGVRAGLSSTSGSFNTYLSKGRTMGWLNGDRNHMEATPDGIAAIGSYEPLPEGMALLEYWLRDLGQGGSGRILKALADVHPNYLTKEELGAATELSEKSGSFNTYLSKLRTLELIEGSNPLKASDEFFQ